MKVAVYTEQGVTQIVLTPQNEWEKKVALQVMNHTGKLSVHRGSFYECRGGYFRHGYYYDTESFSSETNRDDSVMLRLDAPEPAPHPTGENLL